MQCLYCGKPLGLLRELADGEFCSGDHRTRYRNLTKRAFGRLMQSRPEPAMFVTPRQMVPELPPRLAAAPPQVGPLLQPSLVPWPKTRASRGEMSPAGPFFQFYATLMAPTMPVEAGAGALVPAGARSMAGPVPACPRGLLLADAESMAFSVDLVRTAPASAGLKPIDLPLAALDDAVSHQPSMAPVFLPPRIQETAAARIPTNGVAFSLVTPKPLLAAGWPVPDLSACLPGAAYAAPVAAACLPAAAVANSPEPLGWSFSPVMPRLGPVLLAASFSPAPAAPSEARQVDTPFRPMASPAVALSRSAAPSIAPLGLAALASLSPLAIPPRPAACARRLAPGADALAFPAPATRLLKLGVAADRLVLKASDTVREEVLGSDMASDPVGDAVKPSLGPGAVLPALASLFRYGRPSRAATTLPHVTEGINPHNRLAFPVAYRELPMPALAPRVPRSSNLRIVETFEYLKPLEAAPIDLLQNLVRLWRTAPAYLRFATVSACVILLMWTAVPSRALTGLVASRWGRVQRQIEQRATVELTEDFRDDMSQWGGSGDWAQSWRISKAGYARPGRLALYQPSMQMRDYHIEFLMQIEKQAVGFAYRATDRENFYATKITLAKPGPLPVLSLVRYPVIGGREGPKVEIPIRVLLHNNTPYRVQLTVNGRDYSTSIEGQLVDFWRDDQLKTGGVGFFSDTGDRARLYWMKVGRQDDFVGRVCAYFYPNPTPERSIRKPK